MAQIMGSFLRKGMHRNKLNILSCPTHPVDLHLAATGHEFYWYTTDGVLPWRTEFRQIPPNCYVLEKNVLPVDVDFDCVISQNKFGQFQILSQIANQLQIPLISIEHTCPMPQWSPKYLEYIKQMRGNINVFITDFSRKAWGWSKDEAIVIEHGVDTELFKPSNIDKEKRLIVVANDFINRDWCLNYQGFQRITAGLPVRILGNTPGLSEPAKSVGDLIEEYNKSFFLLNTATHSPIPMVVLEAMSCGLPIVSYYNPMIATVIQNGENGFVSSDEQELRKYCEVLLNNREECIRMGEKARQTVLDRFNLDRLVKDWNKVLERIK